MRLGLQEKSGGNKVFLVIKHDTICQESKVERPGFEPVVVTNPQTDEQSTKYIKRYGSVVAFIRNIEWRDTGDKYEQQYTSWRIHLDMGEENPAAVLEIPYQSRHSSRFMKLAENIDYSKPVELRAWYDARGKSTAFYVGQWANEADEKSTSVPQKYTRDNPSDCPEPIQRLGGKWDFGDQMDFLHDRMIRYVIPKVEAANANGYHPQPAEHFTVEPEEEPTLSRDELVAKVQNLCTQLNANGDEIKWNKATLNNFVNETYQVTDGMDSMTPVYLAKLIALLTKRLEDLELPF